MFYEWLEKVSPPRDLQACRHHQASSMLFVPITSCSYHRLYPCAWTPSPPEGQRCDTWLASLTNFGAGVDLHPESKPGSEPQDTAHPEGDIRGDVMNGKQRRTQGKGTGTPPSSAFSLFRKSPAFVTHFVRRCIPEKATRRLLRPQLRLKKLRLDCFFWDNLA